MQDYIKQTGDVIKNKLIKFKNAGEYRLLLGKAQLHLSKKDKILKEIIAKVGNCRLKPHKKYFETLVDAIISQQLSVKAAESIFKRFKESFKNSNNDFPSPQEIIDMDKEKLRKCGLSYPKVKYIKDLSSKVIEGKLKIKKLNLLDDEEIITELIQVKGIGVWTAHMFLIFCLGRFNVLPGGDLGLKKAVMLNYK